MNRRIYSYLSVLTFILLLPFQVNAQCDGADFQETNGIAVIETEAVSYPSGWQKETSASGYTGSGYLAWRGSNYFGSPGNAVITYKVKINSPGVYRFQWHNKVGIGSNGTEHNDSWLRIPDAYDFFAQQGSSIKYPQGGKFRKSNKVVEGSSGNGWMKIYNSGGASNFNWTSYTSDNDAHKVYAEFTSSGVYTIQVSARSQGHFIDRIVLYKENQYSESSATNTSRATTNCSGGGGGGGGGGEPNCDNISLSLSDIDVSSCGGSDGSITSSVSGANGNITYSWNSGETTSSLENVSAGTYTLTITDEEGCTDSASIQVTEPTPPSVSLSDFSDVKESDPSFSLSGGNPGGGTYSGPGVSNNNFDPGIGPGTYTITYTYTDPQTDCSGSDTASITVLEDNACDNFALELSGTNITTCGGSDGSISASVTGANGSVTYSWSNGATTASLQGLEPGTYTLTVEDQESCSAIKSITLVEPEAPEVTLADFPTLETDDEPYVLLEGSPTGGTYSGPGVSDGVFDPGIGAGEYQITYTYTDPDTLCSAEVNGMIIVKEPFIYPEVTEFLLVDADANEVIQSILPNESIVLSELPTTNLDIEAITNNENVGSVVLEMSGEITATATENQPPYTLFGIPGDDYGGTEFSLGTYNVKATPYTSSDASGEVGTALEINFTMVVAPPDCSNFTAEITTSAVTHCTEPNGSASIEVTGGVPPYIYRWENGDDTASRNSLEAGNYLVSVSDSQGCTLELSVTIEENLATPEVSIAELPVLTVADDPIVLSGGFPEGGTYSGDGVQDGVFDPAAAGAGNFEISYTYTDLETGCSNSDTTILEVVEDFGDIPPSEAVVFPNPVTNLQYQVKLPENTTGQLQYGIYNSRGKLLYEGKIMASSQVIDFDLNKIVLPVGIYHLLLEGGNLDDPIAISFINK